MSAEDTFVQYRSTVTEEPTRAIDEIILNAANRRAMRVRTLRRSVVLLGAAAVVIVPFWATHVSRAPEASRASDYGREEGATRYYLMNVAAYSGPGSAEDKQ